MQDKDIDQLFGNALQDFEVEPDKRVWQNIAYNLDGGKRRGRRIAWLSIAATAIIVAMAGLYFTRQDTTKGDKNDSIAALPKRDKAPAIKSEPVRVVVQKPVYANVATNTTAPQLARVNKSRKQIAKQPDVAIYQQAMAESRGTVLAATVPDMETSIIERPEMDDDVQFKTRLTPAVQMPQAKSMAAVAHKKPRIKSLGDLINVVVSKVDKRKDKLIEFTNTDGDEATITGINLGFVKIKKQD